MSVQPKFKRGKTYDGRRGRLRYQIDGIITPSPSRHVYICTIHRGTGYAKGQKIDEDTLLQLARLKKKDKSGIVYLSASQLGTFRRCRRKWAWTYIDGIVSPSSEAMEYGTEVHAVLEHYMKTGEWKGKVDAVATAQQCADTLPPPCDDTLGIEKPINMTVLNGQARFVGFIDLLVPGRHGHAPEVGDYKTTKDLRYAKTPEDLKTDEQAVIYSKYAFEVFRNANVVTARWRYVCARPSRAKAAVKGRPRNPRGFKDVQQVMTRAQVNQEWEGILEDAWEMVKLSSDLTIWAEDVNKNEAACGDYGGCFFRSKCGVTQDSLGSLIAHQRVAHLKGAQDGEVKMPTETLMDIINRQKAKAAAQTEQPATEVAQTVQPTAPAATAEIPLAERQKVDGAQGVNPPEVVAEMDPELAAAMVKPTPQTWIDRLQKGHKPRTDDEKVWRAKQAEPQTMAMGNPAKATADNTMAIGQDQTAEILQAQQGQAIKDPTAPATTTKGLFILCVDCIPAKGEIGIQLSNLLRPMKDAVAQMKEIPHWNLAKYREGEQLLAACVEKQFTNGEKPTGMILADSSTTEWKACGDVLTELADVVVRGL